MQPGIWQILIVAIVVLVLFGRGRISEMMGDFGKGISSFKKGMTEENNTPSEPKPRIETQSPQAGTTSNGMSAGSGAKAEKVETPAPGDKSAS